MVGLPIPDGLDNPGDALRIPDSVSSASRSCHGPGSRGRRRRV